jgi:hypothetical protein
VRHALLRHFYGWLAYTLSRAEQSAVFAEEIEDGWPARGARRRPRPRATAGAPATFDQTHNLVLVASYQRGAWELGLRYRW